MQTPGARTLLDIIVPIGVVDNGHAASDVRHVLGCGDGCITECQVDAEGLRRYLGLPKPGELLGIDVELPGGEDIVVSMRCGRQKQRVLGGCRAARQQLIATHMAAIACRRHNNPTHSYTPSRIKSTHTRRASTGIRPHAPGQQAGVHLVSAHTERHNPLKVWTQRLYEGVSRGLVWFRKVCTASCGCHVLNWSLFGFLGAAGLTLPV